MQVNQTLVRVFNLSVITSCCIALLIACGSHPKKDPPEWLAGMSKRYPTTLYLTGRGTADKLALAEDRARGALAKTLEVEIHQQNKDVQTFSRTNEGGQVQTNTSTDITRSIATSAKKVVRGIEIGDVWRDSMGMHHVLAVLSRNQAGMALRNEITERDQTTGVYLNKAADARDQLEKIMYLDRALTTQLPRVALQKTLQVIDKTGAGVESKYNVGKIQAALIDAFASITLRPKVIGDQVQAMTPILAGSVSKAGFTATQQSAESDFVLEGSLDVDDLGKKEGWYWLKGTFSVNLLDKTGHSRGNQRWDLKVSARDKVVAQRRLLDKVSQKLETSLRNTIISFAKRN